MIYSIPRLDEPLDQGDLLDGCPLVTVADQSPDRLDLARLDFQRGIILTQTCDIANEKIDLLVVAAVFETHVLIDANVTPYREHLAKHFADTYSQIGLPQPYETI